MRRFTILALLTCLVASVAPGRAAGPTTFSNVRYSMSDGVKVAADVYLPAGGLGGGPYPCLVELTPYRKELRAAEGASFLPARGFVLIEMDARGNGGSQGEYDIVFSTREQKDAAEVIEQSATTGVPGLGQICLPKVGMFGGSYSGIIQYLVASAPAEWYPQHLAVIAPQRAYGDLYRDIVYHGGMVIGSFGQIWSSGTQAYYTAPPLDVNTPDGAKAWTDHLSKNSPIMAAYLANQYIDATYTSNDSAPNNWTQKLYEDSSILPRIGNLRVPTLHLAGWFDAFTRGQMLTFEQALAQEGDGTGRGPNYLIVGPWNHSNTHFVTPNTGFSEDLAAWYHYWLDGGSRPAFMDKPRVRYYEMGTGAVLDTTGRWKTATSWPLPDAEYQRHYLRAGGLLSPAAPSASEARSDSYLATPAAGTAETGSRWDNAASGSVPQPAWDQRTDEPKGLSFTETFDHPVHIDGPINLHLQATTTGLPDAPVSTGNPGAAQLTPSYHDTDFVVKLSDVAPDGTATLITQGYLRASHRALDVTRSEYIAGELVRPLHFDDSQHVSPPVPGADTAYDIEVWPTAKTFAAGHGLRVDIYSSDTPNHLTLLKPAVNTVLHAPDALSYLTLPIVAS